MGECSPSAIPALPFIQPSERCCKLCEQDKPPTLYSIPADALACCAAPDSAACKKGFPTVTKPNPEIFLNGLECSE
jgi:hypothetical protein